MAKKETAEQKLLKMIEASAGPATVAVKTEQKVVKKQHAIVWIKASNNLLIIAIVLCSFLLAREMKAGMDRMNKGFQFSGGRKSAKSLPGAESLVPTLQRLSYYLTGVKKRNIFQPVEKEEVSDLVQDPGGAQLFEQKVRQLKLVGISWLDNVDSASVIVEDTEKKETHFFKKGDKIKNSGIIIKTIYADSVALGYENEEIILRYDNSKM